MAPGNLFLGKYQILSTEPLSTRFAYLSSAALSNIQTLKADPLGNNCKSAISASNNYGNMEVTLRNDYGVESYYIHTTDVFGGAGHTDYYVYVFPQMDEVYQALWTDTLLTYYLRNKNITVHNITNFGKYSNYIYRVYYIYIYIYIYIIRK